MELDIDPTGSDASEGKLGTMVQWVRMLGYQVIKSGIEPSLPPAATFASMGLDLELKLMPESLLPSTTFGLALPKMFLSFFVFQIFHLRGRPSLLPPYLRGRP